MSASLKRYILNAGLPIFDDISCFGLFGAHYSFKVLLNQKKTLLFIQMNVAPYVWFQGNMYIDVCMLVR